MATSQQQIGEYFENSFQFHLSLLYGINSSINLLTLSNNLGLTSSQKSTVDSDANNTAIRVKRKISDYYETDTPSKINLVPKNPKVSKFFSGLYSKFDNSNPSDVLLEFSQKTFPEEKYFGISLKHTGMGKRTVKANLGVTDILKLFEQSGSGTNWAPNFLYAQFAEKIVKARKSDVETNFSNYGLKNKPNNHFPAGTTVKWFNATFVRNLKNGKNLFESDANQIKDNYINYFEQGFRNLSQEKLKRFIIEDALKEVSLPLYLVAKSGGGVLASYSTDKILDIVSSTIVVSTRKTPKGESRIMLKKQVSASNIIEIRIKFASGQDMTSSIKIEIT